MSGLPGPFDGFAPEHHLRELFIGFSLGSFVFGIAWTHAGWSSISFAGAARIDEERNARSD